MNRAYTRETVAQITRSDQAASDGRTVEMAISSETPVERYFGIEVLDHSAEAVDLSRLRDGRHPLLLNHETRTQIGVLRDPKLGEDRMLRTRARFSRSALGQEIYQDVQDEIRSLVSVGYEIVKVREEMPGRDGAPAAVRELTGEEFEREMEQKHGVDFYRAGVAASRGSGDEPPVYRVTRWVPFEASIVPIPADPQVGIGRAAGAATPTPEAAKAEPAAAGAAPLEPETARSSSELPRIEAATPPSSSRSKHMEPQNTPTPADLERERVKQICDLGEQYTKFVSQRDVADAIRNGRSAEQFKDTILEKMQSRHTDTSALHIGMSANEVQRYSLARAIVASMTGNWAAAGLELAASRAVEKLVGAAPEGFYVPFDAFLKRDFNVGTASEAGNLVATQLRTDLYVDALRDAMVLSRMGVRILAGLSGNVDIPRKDTAGTIGMLSEIGSASETSPATALLSLTPKRMGAYTEYSKQALIQSAMALEPLIRDDLLTGAAVKIENQMINGVGSSNEFTGIRNTSGIGTSTAGANGAAVAWATIVDLESQCANLNAEPDLLAGYVTNTKVRGKAKQVQKASNLPFIWTDGATPLNGYRVGITNAVPSNLTKGTSTTICSAGLFSSDWSHCIIGLFGAPDITVDPYTKADTGQVRITLNQFADGGLRLPAAFAKIEDWLTA